MDLADCLRHNILQPDYEHPDAVKFIDSVSLLAAPPTDSRLRVRPDLISTYLSDQGFFPIVEASNIPDMETFGEEILSQSPSDLSYGLFGTFDAAVAMNAVKYEALRVLGDTTYGHSNFGQHLDPNADLLGQFLDHVDFEQLTHLYVQFDSKNYLPNYGQDIGPDDFTIEPELIKEFSGLSAKDKEAYAIPLIKEFAGLGEKGVLRLSIEPYDQKSLPTKLVLKVKMNADGSYDKHKVRVVVKGFLARLGLDFYSTFAPTTMLVTARVVMAAAVHHRVPVHHADIPL